MKPQDIPPLCMIFLSVVACVAYACMRDWRHAVYWAASAVLIASVTF